MNTYTIKIFINQRFWKEVPATVDETGMFNYEPALYEISRAMTNNEFTVLAIRKPSELVSIELRPNTLVPKPHTI